MRWAINTHIEHGVRVADQLTSIKRLRNIINITGMQMDVIIQTIEHYKPTLRISVIYTQAFCHHSAIDKICPDSKMAILGLHKGITSKSVR